MTLLFSKNDIGHDQCSPPLDPHQRPLPLPPPRTPPVGCYLCLKVVLSTWRRSRGRVSVGEEPQADTTYTPATTLLTPPSPASRSVLTGSTNNKKGLPYRIQQLQKRASLQDPPITKRGFHTGSTNYKKGLPYSINILQK